MKKSQRKPNDFNSEIDAALATDDPIPRERFLEWIHAAGNLLVLAKLYRVTETDYYRIQTDLGREETCALILRYLLECLRQNVQDNGEIQNRFETANSLHHWFCHIAKRNDSSAILDQAVLSITNLYLVSGEEIQKSIETGFLEHVLETASLRPYFASWASDERLTGAWGRALDWGKARPDFMSGLLEEFRKRRRE